MKWLLWREFRANRWILIEAAVLLLFPYTWMLILYVLPSERDPNEDYDFGSIVITAAVFSYGLSPLTIAFLGGNAFASERADRSAEFMMYLPVSKTRRLVSKLCLAAIVTAVIWGINLSVIWSVHGKFPWRYLSHGDLLIPEYVAFTAFLMFGVAWLISAVQSSPIFAACGGIAAFVLLIGGLLMLANIQPNAFQFHLPTMYLGTAVVLAIISFSAGTWYYLKRVEP